MAVIAIDLGGTKCASAIFDRSGEKVHQSMEKLQGREGRAVGELVQEQISAALDVAARQRVRLTAIGISVPGIASQGTGHVWAPNIPGWESYPLLQAVAETLGKKKVPIHIAGDRACYILGETWMGAAKGCQNAVFLAVGTGIGAGLMVDGKIISGANDIAGAIGWLALDRPYRTEYKACGCFEHHASGEGIAKVARELLARDRKYMGSLRSKKTIRAHDVFAAFEKGDPVARRTLEVAIEFWGMAVANIVSLLNPEKIIFGGGVFGPAIQFLDRIYAEAKKWAQPISITQVTLESSKLGSDAGLFGAGYLAFQQGKSGSGNARMRARNA